MRQNAFGGRAPPGPAGEVERSPRPPIAAIGEGREWEKGRKGVGRGKGTGGREGEDDLHPTLFRPWNAHSES